MPKSNRSQTNRTQLILAILFGFLVQVPALVELHAQDNVFVDQFDRVLIEGSDAPDKREIVLTGEGLDEYFDTYAKRGEVARALIPLLGAPQFAERNRATEALIALPNLHREIYEEALKNAEAPEIRNRLSKVIRETAHKPVHEKFPNRNVCRAILAGLAENHETDDVARHLVRIVETHDDIKTLFLAATAVENTKISPDDLRLWSQSDGDVPTRLQWLVLPAVAKTDPDLWLPRLRAWTVRLEESKQLKQALLARLYRLNLNDGTVVEELIESLEDDRAPFVRQCATLALRQAFDQPEFDGDAKKWREWRMNQPLPIELNLPVRIEFASFEEFLRDIAVVSSGFDRGNSAVIKWRDRTLMGPKGEVSDRRGINVVAIYQDEPLIIGSYDFYEDPNASTDFARDIAELPEGSFVAVVACDEASREWDDSAQRALESIGVEPNPEGTLTNKFRHAYYAVGVKGGEPGSAREAIDQRGGPLVFPKSFADQATLVNRGPDEHREDPRIRIIRGERQVIPPAE